MPQASHSAPTPEQARQQAHLEELLRRAVAGDDEARNQLLVALLPRLRDKVRWSLNVICRDAQSDVLNSAIRRVLDQKAHPATLSQYLVWVGAIIRNRCHDEWRRRVRGPGPLDREVPDPNDDEEKNRRAVLVWTTLQLLPDHYRQVLEHTYYDRLSSKEIGERMGLSEGAVNLVRFRARKHLKKHLKNLLEDRHDD